VEAYRDMGYLPEGLRNYLLRLGWSKGDQEYFTDAEMVEALFDLKGLGKAPARLDFDKMSSVNAWHMKRAEDARLIDLLWDRLEGRKDVRLDDQAKVWVSSAMKVLKERAATLAELEDQTYFLIRPRPIEIDGQSRKGAQG
jgi:glutamyl-tRNA synthetase